ncbi:olfactory receptor 5P72-like [Ascaphus truei]|uniref:olfactory receptor 5P72-like n=1 Tax=Ascaphus truei TaxID=8439 RepID=UPI003F595508
MCEDNQTMVTEIILLGFQNIQRIKTLLFCLFLLIYIVILIGNLLIILLVSTNDHLNHPMYFFLKHLAFADLLLTTTIVPNMLHVILMEGGRISIFCCIMSQSLFVTFSAFAQSCLLMVMSFDRYLAICNPLRYSSIMNMNLCFKLAIGCWTISFVLGQCEFFMIFQFQFCTINVIDHFFCDFAPLLALSSSDTFTLIWVDFVFTILEILLPFVFVIVSYVCIFISIVQISSIGGKKKAFSTCSSHLLIVCTYYGTQLDIYVLSTGSNSFNENKLKSLAFIVLTPFINPIIYSLRNQEIK